MSEQQNINELTNDMPAVPVLTFSSSQAAEVAKEPTQVKSETTVDTTPANVASEAVEEMDTSMLSAEEKKVIQEFSSKIDLNNTDHVLLFGADAQKKIADFSDSALESVRNADSGEVGEMLTSLVNEIKGFNANTEKPKGLSGLFWNANKAVNEMKTQFDSVEENVDTIIKSLEGHQIQLLKDISMFNHLYDMNTQYFKELTMYIVAGEQKLKLERETTYKELKEKALLTGDAMDAQKANDMANNLDRFEKKLHDLKLTRQVALQMAPQIRLLQNNNSLLVERIQSTLANTLPLWKSQMVIALGMHRSKEALKAQTAVTNMTNELLIKNAEALKVGTIETAKEAERGVIDIETLVQTNQSLITSLDEVLKIQSEAREKRISAEKQMVTMEHELKNKLLTLK